MTFPRPCCTPDAFCLLMTRQCSTRQKKKIQTALSKISEDLKRVTDWFKGNKLSLNINKTNYMIFTNTRNAIQQHTLRIGNKILNSAAHIIIDNRLNWHTHIYYCMKKMSAGLYAINASKRLLPQKHLNTIYHSSIHPYINTIMGLCQQSIHL